MLLIGGMRYCLALIILYLLVCCAEGTKDLPVRSKQPSCKNPSGKIGESFIQKCLKKTCTRRGQRAYWKKSYASDDCCNYNQKWFKIGQNITQIFSSDNCTIVNVRCTQNRESGPGIMMDTTNDCLNVNEVKTLIKIHSNNTEMKIEELSAKIDESQKISLENSEKLSDIENLIQFFHNDTDNQMVSSKPKTTNSKTTFTTTLRTPPTPNDSEILLIGPGHGSNGASEVLNLPSLTRANCSPPTFPNGEYWGYVGTLTTDGPLLCGGSVRRVFHLECHLLANSGEWVGMPPMQNARVWAAAVTLGDAWWVTGGRTVLDRNTKWLATTELWHNQSWSSYTDLPAGSDGHCLVKLNTTHVFLTGGYITTVGYSAASYIFSSATGFVKQSDMISARGYHACSLYSDNLVFVAGGQFNNIKTTEYFSLSTLRWLPGPDLPNHAPGGKMISVMEKTLFIGGQGNKKILSLEKLLLSSKDTWEWVEVAEMKTARHYFEVFQLNKNDCKYCN